MLEGDECSGCSEGGLWKDLKDRHRFSWWIGYRL